MECLEFMVGLSDQDCKCFVSDRPTDYNQSASGLFITDEISLLFTGSASDCAEGGVWDILAKARAKALLDLPQVLSASILAYNREKFPPFPTPAGSAGGIKKLGNRAWNGTYNFQTDSNIAGVLIRPKFIKGGRAIITGGELALFGAQNENITIFVASSINSERLAEAQFLGGADGDFTPFTFKEPVILPFDDENEQDREIQYFIYYEIPAGASFVNNEILSQCCGGYKSAEKNPFLYYATHNRDIYGFESFSLETAKDQPISVNNSARGLRLDIEFGCDGLSWLCGLASAPGTFNDTYQGSGLSWGMHVADLIKFKAVSEVCKKIKTSQNINSITLLSIEEINEIKNYADEVYSKGVNFLAKNFPAWANDCYICKRDGFSIQSIKR